jgi:hypothetical protein
MKGYLVMNCLIVHSSVLLFINSSIYLLVYVFVSFHCPFLSSFLSSLLFSTSYFILHTLVTPLPPLLLSIQVPGAPVEQPPNPVPIPIVVSLDVTAKMRISVTCVNVTVQPTQVMLTSFNGTGDLFQAPETTVTRTFAVLSVFSFFPSRVC